MSPNFADLTAPLWAYRDPPPDLSAEGIRLHRSLIEPLCVALGLRAKPEYLRQGTIGLLQDWCDRLRGATQHVATVIQLIRVRSPNTWRAGHAIGHALAPALAALDTLITYIKRPRPTERGTVRTIDSLREEVINKLNALDPVPLLDNLVTVVTSDYPLQRGDMTVPVSKPSKKPRPKQPTVPDWLKKPLELWRTFQATEKEAERRPTFKNFRKWAWDRHAKNIPDDFEEWWRNTYTRMKRRADRAGG